MKENNKVRLEKWKNQNYIQRPGKILAGEELEGRKRSESQRGAETDGF